MSELENFAARKQIFRRYTDTKTKYFGPSLELRDILLTNIALHSDLIFNILKMEIQRIADRHERRLHYTQLANSEETIEKTIRSFGLQYKYRRGLPQGWSLIHRQWEGKLPLNSLSLVMWNVE